MDFVKKLSILFIYFFKFHFIAIKLLVGVPFLGIYMVQQKIEYTIYKLNIEVCKSRPSKVVELQAGL